MFNRRVVTALLIILAVLIVTYIPVLAVNEENGEYDMPEAVQTSDYTFIVNAILLIVASVTFILIRLKRNDKK